MRSRETIVFKGVVERVILELKDYAGLVMYLSALEYGSRRRT